MSTEDNVTYWQQRWDDKATGWHLSSLNPAIVDYRDKWIPEGSSPRRIFFPLCGKTHDMIHMIKEGHSVLGLEAIDQAFTDFENENSLKFHTRDTAVLPKPIQGKLEVLDVTPKDAPAPTFSAGAPLILPGSISVLKGDFFAYPTLESAAAAGDAAVEDLKASGLVGICDSAFDRGSFVAIRPEMRCAYEKVMYTVLAPGASVLLATFNYDKSEMDGAPWAVTEEDVRTAFPESRWEVNWLGEKDTQVGSKRLKANGGVLTWCKDGAAIIVRK